MDWPERVSAVALTVVVLACAVGFAVVQVRLLRGPVRSPDLSDEERRHLRRQAWRRLFGCLLLLLLGGQLVAYLLFLGDPAQRLADLHGADPSRQQSPDERRFAEVFGYFFLVFLLLLLVLVLLAAFDLWSVRRRGVQERRRLLDDRRAMLQRQVGRLRQEGNGHG